MKPGTIQLLLAVLRTDETISVEHSAQLRGVIEQGGSNSTSVNGPLLTISEAARQLGYCRPWLYGVLRREASWAEKDKTFRTVPPPGGGEGFRLLQSDIDNCKRQSTAFKPRQPKPSAVSVETKNSNGIGNQMG